MKIALLALLLGLSGCATTYTATRTIDGGSTTLKVRSYREFPGGISIHYERETGTFVLEAGEVRNDDQMSQVLLSLIPLIPAGD